MFKAFKKTGTDNSDLQKVQNNVQAAIEPLIASAIGDGQLLTGVVLVAGTPSMVAHQLGRDILGWIVVGTNAQADVWDEQALNTFKSRFVRLQTSADVTVNLWVF